MHAGRFRWDIVDSGQPVQSSLDSYATIEEAWTAGRIEMGKLISRRWFGD
jgi:hypothetical protein